VIEVTHCTLGVTVSRRFEKCTDLKQLTRDLGAASKIQMLERAPAAKDRATRLPEGAAALPARHGMPARFLE
jgi:hypothetical protein